MRLATCTTLCGSPPTCLGSGTMGMSPDLPEVSRKVAAGLADDARAAESPAVVPAAFFPAAGPAAFWAASGTCRAARTLQISSFLLFISPPVRPQRAENIFLSAGDSAGESPHPNPRRRSGGPALHSGTR